MPKKRASEIIVPGKLLRGTGTVLDLENSSGRLVSYVLSDASVGRDNHVIAADGWDLKNFLRNPVMPWAHDATQPPIAKWIDVGTRGSQLVGTAEYADYETYPFADTIYRLVKGGFLNAVSTGWIPRDWKFSTDRSRPGGVDFFKVELLEASQVPVPALPTALVTARSQGIDTGPIFEWAERALDSNGIAVLPRAEVELLRREAKMPAARGKRKPSQPSFGKRSLYHVGWLAMLLDELGYLHYSTEFEAAIEEDGSAVPAELLAALKSLGDVLIKMTVEEVTELLAGDDEENEADAAPADVIEMASGIDAKRKAMAALRRLDEGALVAVTAAMNAHLRGQKVTFTDGGPVISIGRAGKVLSAENERCLRDAHDHMSKATEIVRSVVEKAADDGDDGGEDDDEARAIRARRARALEIAGAL